MQLPYWRIRILEEVTFGKVRGSHVVQVGRGGQERPPPAVPPNLHLLCLTDSPDVCSLKKEFHFAFLVGMAAPGWPGSVVLVEREISSATLVQVVGLFFVASFFFFCSVLVSFGLVIMYALALLPFVWCCCFLLVCQVSCLCAWFPAAWTWTYHRHESMSPFLSLLFSIKSLLVPLLTRATHWNV